MPLTLVADNRLDIVAELLALVPWHWSLERLRDDAVIERQILHIGNKTLKSRLELIRVRHLKSWACGQISWSAQVFFCGQRQELKVLQPESKQKMQKLNKSR